MHRLLMASLLVFAAISGAQAQSPFTPDEMQKLESQTLPVFSFWVSNRGTQLKLYAFNGAPVPGTPNVHDYFSGVVNSASAPPGCQFQTFELLPKSEFLAPQIAFGVAWKNWTVDCHAQTVWTGILRGNKLGLEWALQRVSPTGKIFPTRKGGLEIFTRMP